MNRIFSLLGAIIAIMSIATSHADDAPKISFDQTVFDAGRTSQLARVTGSFSFCNNGTAPLKLEPPTTACACTTVRADSLEVAPGMRGTISFETDAVGAVGPKTSEIIVLTNDPLQPKVALTLKVDWIKVFELDPPAAALGPVGIGITTNVVVQVTRLDEEKLAIAGLVPSSSNIRAELDGPVMDKIARIKVTFHAGTEPGLAQGSVSVRGPGPDDVMIDVPVYAQVRRALVASPSQLIWTVRGNANPAAERKIRITNFTPERRLQITNVSCDLEEIALSMNPSGAEPVIEVVAVLKQAPAASATGTIRIETNLPDQPSIEVPFKVNVQPKP